MSKQRSGEWLLKCLLIPSKTQWKTWSLPSKIGVIGVLATLIFGVVGLAFSVVEWPRQPPLKAYETITSQREVFEKYVRVEPDMHPDRLRIACSQMSSDSCVTANLFAEMFSDAGWEIEGNKVFREEASLPVGGVSTVTNDRALAGLPSMPPGRGRWSSIDLSTEIVIAAFRLMDNPVGASSDPSLADGTLGVYFGPDTETKVTLSKSLKVLGPSLLELIKQGEQLKAVCLSESADECKVTLSPWEAKVSSLLKSHIWVVDHSGEWGAMWQQSDATAESISHQLNYLIGLLLISEH
jgi:hypothetical protein